MTYRDLCERNGMNAWHPRTWTSDQEATYAAWKLERFREKWALYKTMGVGTWMPRETIRSRVREDLDALRAPAPSRPWTICPCHATPRAKAESRERIEHGLTFIASVGLGKEEQGR